MARRYTVFLKPAAERALKKIKDQPTQRRLAEAIDELAEDPRPAGVKPLEGEPGILRIRVSNYRILYSVGDEVLTVLVVTIGHRREVYRRGWANRSACGSHSGDIYGAGCASTPRSPTPAIGSG